MEQGKSRVRFFYLTFALFFFLVCLSCFAIAPSFCYAGSDKEACYCSYMFTQISRQKKQSGVTNSHSNYYICAAKSIINNLWTTIIRNVNRRRLRARGLRNLLEVKVL